ncbi:DNA polymerase III subunit chi [Pleionea mediterranea]|uniref:DNA polymerase III chi subunit n=1 Tax=Pleionea mediterranea TaxID=523701 RepID=A0A316FYF2_9GAMM|nr:DNA polymerase III subunit chi [Pleionea mediterranea]PWK53453.1 DNA polymerase III chi subunit [Pleionea mediterranea]
MTNVEFFILDDEAPKAAFRLSINMIQKAYQSKRRVFIHTGSKRDAEYMDELLWTQEPSSFLPHLLSGEAEGIYPPIQIGYGQEPNIRPDVLVNLADDVPSFHGQFEKVIEFAHGDEQSKEKARERFKFYRERGYPLKHFNPSAE